MNGFAQAGVQSPNYGDQDRPSGALSHELCIFTLCSSELDKNPKYYEKKKQEKKADFLSKTRRDSLREGTKG